MEYVCLLALKEESQTIMLNYFDYILECDCTYFSILFFLFMQHTNKLLIEDVELIHTSYKELQKLRKAKKNFCSFTNLAKHHYLVFWGRNQISPVVKDIALI